MLEAFLTNLAPVKRMADRLEQKHPVLSMLVFQIAVALFLIAAVGGIALAGGGMIWLFYHRVGTM